MTTTIDKNKLLPQDVASRIDYFNIKYKGEIFDLLNPPTELLGVQSMQTAYINNGEIDEAIELGKNMKVGLIVDRDILKKKGKEILINISLSPDGLRVGLREAISYAKKLGVDIYTDLKLMKEVLSEWIKDTRDGPSDITKFARSEFPNQTTKSNSPYGGKIALKVNPNQVWFQEHDWFKNEEGEWFKEMKKEGSKFIIVLPKDSAWKLFADCPAADQNLKENKVTLIDLSK